MVIHDWIMDIHNCIQNWIVDIHDCRELYIYMYIHELIMGIHNSVMDIPLEGTYSLLASHISMYSSVASQRIHDANNVIYVETMLKLIMTLLLRCMSSGIELPYHLGHAYIISNTLQTGCTAVVVGST